MRRFLLTLAVGVAMVGCSDDDKPADSKDGASEMAVDAGGEASAPDSKAPDSATPTDSAPPDAPRADLRRDLLADSATPVDLAPPDVAHPADQAPPDVALQEDLAPTPDKPSGGCSDNSHCGSTEYCDLTQQPGCGGTGVCKPRPLICAPVYMPVCGCDGNTYGNECNANGAGTNVARYTPC